MHFLKVISGLAFAALASITMQTHADVIAVSCTWSTVSQSSGPNSFYLSEVCKNGSTYVATRNRQYGAGTNNSCNIGTYSPYFQTGGACDSPSFGYNAPAQKQCLRPNQIWGTYRVGQNASPAPSQATIDAFCGYGCANASQQISSDMYGATIQITCGTTTN